MKGKSRRYCLADAFLRCLLSPLIDPFVVAAYPRSHSTKHHQGITNIQVVIVKVIVSISTATLSILHLGIIKFILQCS